MHIPTTTRPTCPTLAPQHNTARHDTTNVDPPAAVIGVLPYLTFPYISLLYRLEQKKVHAVYKRRYQLRDVGLEVFDVFGRSVLVSFSTQAQQEDVLTYLLARGLPASIFAMGK